MIGSLNGILTGKFPTRILVEVGGVGYDLAIPVSTYDRLPELNESVRLLTYLHVREDALLLFGFASADERDVFLHLLSVSGVGPRTALTVLSGMSVSALRQAMRQQDISLLTTVPGIGKKTAERILLELKEKIAEPLEPALAALGAASTQKSGDAVAALVSLGYRRAEAAQAIRKATASGKDMTIEEVVREGLKHVR